MAEAKFGSAGVSTREIDLSGPLSAEPVGIPAGVIGTAVKGPAFVPLTVGILKDFYAKFGETDGKKFGPLAVSEWLRNAQSVTYLRVLGAGTGEKRNTDGANPGNVDSAGFVVGGKLPNDAGVLAENPYANSGGPTGRTYFLGCFMSESAGSTYLSDARAQNSTSAVPIVRGIIFAASGVIPRLSASLAGTNTAPDSTMVADNATTYGSVYGSVKLMDTSAKSEFVLLLNGHKGTDTKYPNVVTASFDPTAVNYFANVLNKDPLKLQQAGYCLYKNWDIHPVVAAVTGVGAVNAAGIIHNGTNVLEQIAFLTTGTLGYNVGSSTVPNFENFETRFEHAKTPWVISQKFGGNPANLFRFHGLDAGVYAHNKIKFSVENITPSSDPLDQYGTFDVLIRDFLDTDSEPRVLERFRGVNLNPTSDRYIAKVIGDLNVYYDFDRDVAGQKLVVDGNYPNKSNYVRVEVSDAVDAQEVDETALPMGFRGYPHLATSGSAPLTSPSASAYFYGETVLKTVVEPPVPMRKSITNGSGATVSVNSSLYWGVQFEQVTSVSTPNASLAQNKSIENHGKYLPDFQTTNMNFVVGNNEGTADSAANGVEDADRFNYNLFSLENIQVVTASGDIADSTQWDDATYVRNGNIVANETNKTRRLATGDLTTANRRYAKFSFFMYGGFDGVNVFDEDAANLTNTAVTEEMDNVSRGVQNGPTVKSYIKAIEIMQNTSDVDVQLLAIPGIRHAIVSDTAIQAVEDRFDALYIMDIEEYDSLNILATGSAQIPSVTNTVSNFADRALDSNFAAAYYPDVIVTDPTTKTNVVAPPSVAVLGAFALNDAVGHPWFAPAGFSRGALPSVSEAKVKLSKPNLDLLYDASINPIVAFPGASPAGTTGGPVVWGQKTLQVAQSALDRVNVRRLLIEIRRQVRDIANRIIFEPNRESTLAKFSAEVNPRLAKIQTQGGLERYLVKIDTTTTTQADVENNTIRGKIYVQPTKSIEFVSLDFVVTSPGKI